MTSCLINQSACGRERENPVCPKCGLDERVVYPGQADREAAQERAEGQYWKAHAHELAARLATLQNPSPQPSAKAVASSVVKVPDIGDFTDVAVIELWVKPGDFVKTEQPLITVESDKASMEIPSSRSGVIQRLLVKLGDKVSEGSAIAELVVPSAGLVFRDARWSPEMVVLPSGKYLMGSPASEPGRSDSEGPQREVTIGYGLALGKHPVTFEEWDTCVADGGTSHKPSDEGWGRGKRPVINVSWDDAQHYVAWLNQKLGIAADDPSRYRLPSEAEWEYACRASTTGMYSTPDGLMCEDWANYDADSNFVGVSKVGRKLNKTTPVGFYPANSWGLYDLHGNVWEWVQDGFHYGYRGAPVDGSAWESETGLRVVRGGSWDESPQSLRSAYYGRGKRDFRGNYIGFRLARTVP